MMKQNVEGTANIVNLCLEHNIKKLGYISSVAALGSVEENKVRTELEVWNQDTMNKIDIIR